MTWSRAAATAATKEGARGTMRLGNRSPSCSGFEAEPFYWLRHSANRWQQDWHSQENPSCGGQHAAEWERRRSQTGWEEPQDGAGLEERTLQTSAQPAPPSWRWGRSTSETLRWLGPSPHEGAHRTPVFPFCPVARPSTHLVPARIPAERYQVMEVQDHPHAAPSFWSSRLKFFAWQLCQDGEPLKVSDDLQTQSAGPGITAMCTLPETPEFCP